MTEPPEIEPTPRGRRPPRRRLVFVVVPLVALTVAANVGDALTTTWADRHPLLLTLLNARNRVLLLTTNQLDPWSYYLAAGARLLAADPLFYLLGRWYGDAMVSWLERRSQTFGEQVRLYERAFAKAAYPLLIIAPNAYVCLFAGAAGMPLGAFFAVNIAGTVLRLYLLRRLGEAFDRPIASVLDFFARYRLPLFILSVALIVFILWNDRRQGKSEIGSMLELAEDPPEDASGPGDEEPEGDLNG